MIRSTVPPQQIRQQYERRELAKRQREQYIAEITTEIGYPAVEGGKPKLGPEGQPLFDHGIPIVEGGKPKLDLTGAPVFEGGRLTKELQTRMKDRAEKIGTSRCGNWLTKPTPGKNIPHQLSTNGTRKYTNTDSNSSTHHINTQIF